MWCTAENTARSLSHYARFSPSLHRQCNEDSLELSHVVFSIAFLQKQSLGPSAGAIRVTERAVVRVGRSLSTYVCLQHASGSLILRSGFSGLCKARVLICSEFLEPQVDNLSRLSPPLCLSSPRHAYSTPASFLKEQQLCPVCFCVSPSLPLLAENH